MFGRLQLPSSISALVLACSVAMPLLVASWRHCRRWDGDASSAWVQRVVHLNRRWVLPRSACALRSVCYCVHHEVDATVHAITSYERNSAVNTVPSGHVRRTPYFYVQLPAVCAAGGYRRHARFSWEHELRSMVGSVHCICIVRKSSSEAVRLHYFIDTMDSFCTGGSRPSIPLESLEAFQ